LFDHAQVRDDDSPLHDTLCSASQFDAHVRSLGVSQQHVVCYSQGLFSSAARAWWMFRVFGHTRVSVLHGGLKAWRERGLPTESGTNNCEPGTFVAELCTERLCTLEQAQARQRQGDQFVDARPPDVFAGERDWFAERDSPASGHPGHIEGARNLPSSSVIEGGRIKPVTALAALVGEAGIDASRPTVTSCSLGVGASGSAFILHLLGNDDVAVFDGAWEAWAAAARATR
jgi:thiosulfate/3-mercaptopyruvate sulfurtransferase